MQIGFFNPHVFFNYNHKDLVQKLNDNDIKIKSIHAPTVDIFQEHYFFGMINKVKEKIKVEKSKKSFEPVRKRISRN